MRPCHLYTLILGWEGKNLQMEYKFALEDVGLLDGEERDKRRGESAVEATGMTLKMMSAYKVGMVSLMIESETYQAGVGSMFEMVE